MRAVAATDSKAPPSLWGIPYALVAAGLQPPSTNDEGRILAALHKSIPHPSTPYLPNSSLGKDLGALLPPVGADQVDPFLRVMADMPLSAFNLGAGSSTNNGGPSPTATELYTPGVSATRVDPFLKALHPFGLGPETMGVPGDFLQSKPGKPSSMLLSGLPPALGLPTMPPTLLGHPWPPIGGRPPLMGMPWPSLDGGMPAMESPRPKVYDQVSGKEYYGAAAYALNDERFNKMFSPLTLELVFRPLMAVVSAFKEETEKTHLSGRKMERDEWISWWSSCHQREPERTMQCIGRLYTFAALGDWDAVQDMILVLAEDGFLVGAETRLATPVTLGKLNWPDLCALMTCRTMELAEAVSTSTGQEILPGTAHDDHVPTEAEKLAARMN